jgi:hypothetical protein
VTRLLRRARPLAGALALLVGLTFVAPPAFAAESSAPLAAAAAPLAASAAAMVEALPAETVAQAAPAKPAAPTAAKPAATTTTEGKSFFKTPTGVVSLVLLGGALGYMAYSFSNGRVKSPAK